MKFQFSLQALMIFMTLLSIAMAGMADAWRKDKANQTELWGPNPGWVTFSDQYGGRGEMLVRDLDNAKEEVEALQEATWEQLEKDPNFKVEGKTKKVKATISKKKATTPGGNKDGLFLLVLFMYLVPLCLFLTSIFESYFVRRDERNS